MSNKMSRLRESRKKRQRNLKELFFLNNNMSNYRDKLPKLISQLTKY